MPVTPTSCSKASSKPINLVIATRGSALALWQANHVKQLLEATYSGLNISLLTIKTRGDKILDRPLAAIGGKGLFVKEIEEALLNGQADFAVHSLKDMPMTLPPGLCIGAVLARGEPEDMFLSHKFPSWQALPPAATVGTSSLRRKAQMLMLRPDLNVQPLRGNINTRLSKLAQGNYDAIILAAAGVNRLGLNAPHMQILPLNIFLPAAGQGTLGVEFLSNRFDLTALFKPLEHAPSRLCLMAERAFLRCLDGGCHAPIAAYATLTPTPCQVPSAMPGARNTSNTPQTSPENLLTITGFIATEDGQKHLRQSLSAPVDEASQASQADELGQSLGINLGQQMKKTGAAILQQNACSEQ